MRLQSIVRCAVLVGALAAYAAVILYAPVRAQVPRPADLTRTERQLAIALARVSINEGGDSEPDGELVAQVTLARGETAAERLHWLGEHSRCVAGPMSQDEAYQRPGNCRWTRNLHPDGRRPRGWRRELDGHWSRTRGRWRTVLERAVEYVRGDRAADVCDEDPDSWDGVIYGADRVAPEGSGRRILDCSVPYTADPAAPGLHNFAVAWRGGPS